MSQSCSCCFRDRVEWSHNFILRQINTSHTTSLHTPKKRAPPSLSTPVLILHSGTIMAPKQKKNKLKISLDLSRPIKKQQKRKYCNFLDVFDTSVPHIKVVVPTRADIPAGLYLKPIVEAFEDDDDGELSTSLKILQCCHCKGEGKRMGLMTTCLRQEGVESLGINLLLILILMTQTKRVLEYTLQKS